MTRADGTLTASWPAVEGATSYHVTYSSDGAVSWSLAAFEHPTASITVTGVDNSATYIVAVRARNAAGDSGWVNSPPAGPYTPTPPPTTTQPPPPPPGAPGEVSVMRGDGTLTASWPAVEGATSYHVTYSSDGAVSWSLAAFEHPTASITVTGVDNSATYIVAVRARNEGGGSGWVNSAPVGPHDPGVDYDTDGDGHIEITTLAQLDAVRYDLDGDGTASTGNESAYAAAFPNAAQAMGCPQSGCTGYELRADLDFDTNGNGFADEGDAYWNDGDGWRPITGFDADFDGNNDTDPDGDGGPYAIYNVYGGSVFAAAEGTGTTPPQQVFGGLGENADVYNLTQTGALSQEGARAAASAQLIDVDTVAKFIAMQWDLNGDGTPESNTSTYQSAFGGSNPTCTGGCTGYELTGNLAITADPSNAGSNYLVPGVWNTTFDGDGYTITNSDHRPLFQTIGAASGSTTAEVKDVVVKNTSSSDVTGGILANKVDAKGTVNKVGVVGTVRQTTGNTALSVDHVGGMVNELAGVITTSYSHADVIVTTPNLGLVTVTIGGLVGDAASGSQIRGSYATGEVDMNRLGGINHDDNSTRHVGGLVGRSAGTVYAVYATGSVTASENYSNATGSYTKAGGLIGTVASGGTLRAGYAIGAVSHKGADNSRNSRNGYGNAVGDSAGTINYVYGSGTVTTSNTSGAQNPTGTATKTETELKAPEAYGTGSAIYANWNFDIDNADNDNDLTTGTDNPWNFGTNAQFPVLAYPSTGDTPKETPAQQQPATFTLAANNTTIYESTEGGSTRATTSTITATLNASKTYDITITLPSNSAYTPATPTITVTAGQTTGTVTLTAVNNTNCGTGTCGVAAPSDVAQVMTPTADRSATLSGTAPTVTITDDDLFGKPTGMSVTGKASPSTELDVTWEAVTAADTGKTTPDGYYVDWKSGAETYDTSARRNTVTGGSTTTSTITGLTANTIYTVRVIAYKSGYEDSVASDEDTAAPGKIDYDTDNDDLIEISNLAQLNAIRQDTDGVGSRVTSDYMSAFPNYDGGMGCPSLCDGYELTTDLDFDTGTKGDRTDDTYYNSGEGWLPFNYNAILEGNQHVVKNLYIKRDYTSGSPNVGFIGLMNHTAVTEIRNLYLTEIDITATSTGNNAFSVGGMVGNLANGATITDSYVSGSISATHKASGANIVYVGGFVGNNPLSTVRKSYSSVTVTATAEGNNDAIAGGLVAWNFLGTIEASYATGDVTATGSTNSASDADAGGLVGRMQGGATVRATYSTGAVSATAGGTVNAGGLVGDNRSGNTVTVGWSGGTVTVTGTPSTTNRGASVGNQAGTASYLYWDTQTSGIADDADTNAPEGKTTSELQTPTEYGDSTSIFGNWNVNVDGVTGNDNPWDFGTNVQYPILDVRTLPAVLNEDVPTVTWALGNASICESTAGTNTNACGASPVTSTTITPTLSAAWLTDLTYDFPADADTYTLSASSLTIPAGSTTVTGITLTAVNNKTCGTAACTGSNASDATLTLSPASSHLRQSSTVPTITIKDDDKLAKPTGVKVSVDDAKARVDWTAVTDAAGYKVEWSTSSTFATHATGSPATINSGTTTNHSITSGLTSGSTYYFRVIATTTAGYDDSAPSDAVSSAPTTNDVDYDADNDGLIEISSLAQLNAVRYDLDGDGAADDATNQTSYNTAFPNAEDNMGCNESVASISSHQNTGNPDCTGYELRADIDLNVSPHNSGAGWTPIGDGTTGYTGKFDGNRDTDSGGDGGPYKISNLFINSSATSGDVYAGLFGVLGTGAAVEKVALDGVSVTAALSSGTAGDEVYAGALAGKNSGTVTVSSSVGSVTATRSGTATSKGYAGGLVGWNDGTIRSAYSRAAVTANANGTGNTNKGYAGGLVGLNDTAVSASFATGDVTATTDDTGTLENGAQVGGLVSENKGTITAAYSHGTGTAKGKDVTRGGLVGSNETGATITASYSTGGHSGAATNGGTLNSGGLAGTSSGTVTNSYWDTTTSGITTTGAGTGKTTSELQTPTTETGIYASWDLNVDGVSGNDDPWDFGTNSQYPVVDFGLTAASQRATLTLSVSPATIYESVGGATSATVTATVSPVQEVPVALTLSASNTAVTLGSTTITVAAGSATGTATVTAVNNQLCGTGTCGVTQPANKTVTLTQSNDDAWIAEAPAAGVSLTVTDDDILAKPTGVKLSVDGAKVQVDWTEVTSADGYKVEWSDSATFATQATGSPATTTGNASTTHKILTGLTSGTKYYFRVTATKSGKEDSVPSDTASVTPTSGDVDYDGDNDGLIDVDSLAKLNAIRWDLDGDGVADKHDANNDGDYTDDGEYDYTSDYAAVFPNPEDNMGCGESGATISSHQDTGNPDCRGYDLTANLDFDTNSSGGPNAGDTYWNSGQGWVPIGATAGSLTARAYTGEFDGGTSHTISNLHINRSGSNTVAHGGLFAELGSGAKVSNLRLKKVSVTVATHSSATSASAVYAGAIAGKSAGSITGSYVTGTVKATQSDNTSTPTVAEGHADAGGLVGYSTGAVTSSYALVTVTAEQKGDTANKEARAGGLVGYQGTSNVVASYTFGTATALNELATGAKAKAGGLIGHLESGSVKASYSHAATAANTAETAATATLTAGGLVGNVQAGGSVVASYATGKPSTSGGSSPTTQTGGLVGYSGGTITNSYWDATTSTIPDDGDNNSPEGKTTSQLQTPTTETGIYANWDIDVGGTSANDDPWDFGTTSQYPAIDYGLTASNQRATLTVTATPSTICETTKGSNSAACGSSNVISSTISAALSTAQDLPVVVTITPDTSAYTLSATSITVNAGSTSGAATVTLTAVNNTTDEADNTLTVGGTTAQNWVGITGASLTIKDDDTLDKPAGVKLSVDGTKVQVDWTAVTGADGYKVEWSDSATFDTQATDSPATIGSGSTTTHKITSGLTSGTTYYFRVTATKSGYDDSAPSDTVSVAAGGTDYDADNDGLIDVNSLVRLNAIRYDLDGDGVVDNASDSGSYDAAFGSAEGNLGCSESVVSIASNHNNTGNPTCRGYELTANLDFDTNSSGGPNAGDTYWNSGQGWLPIGATAGSLTASAYTGEFDGGSGSGTSYTISNLHLNRSGSTTVAHGGLFAQLGSGAVVKNLRLKNVSVTVATNASATSASDVYAGGVAGTNAGSITGSYVLGAVKAVQSDNTGITTEEDAYAGGVVAKNTGSITSSYSRADVTAEQKSATASKEGQAGGLVGVQDGSSATVTASFSTGTVVALSQSATGAAADAGGLVGRNHDGKISHSYSHAHAEAKGTTAGATLTAGGLVGELDGGTVEYSFATGKPTTASTAATPTERKGGLAGISSTARR